MLYIKRRGKHEDYVVEDTDDNIETIVSKSDLFHYAKLGVDIKGVRVVGKSLEVQIYTLTRDNAITRLEILTGIKVMIHNDKLTEVNRGTQGLHF